MNNYMNIIINNRKLLEAHVRTARAIVDRSDALLRDVDAHPETKPMALAWIKQAELWAVNRGDERLASLMRITAMIAKFSARPGWLCNNKEVCGMNSYRINACGARDEEWNILPVGFAVRRCRMGTDVPCTPPCAGARECPYFNRDCIEPQGLYCPGAALPHFAEPFRQTTGDCK